jgi:hypothetical protein
MGLIKFKLLRSQKQNKLTWQFIARVLVLDNPIINNRYLNRGRHESTTSNRLEKHRV